MKLTLTSLSLLASVGSAPAFVVPAVKSGDSPLRMSKPHLDQSERASGGIGFDTRQDQKVDDVELEINWQKQKVPLKSQAIPFLDVPHFMDGSMAGDVGFDPLGFADNEQNLLRYREAEIKHARLAMLAAAGWPMSELFDKKIANMLGMEPVVDATNRAPSVLNGGMGKISPIYWVSCVVLAAAVELVGMFNASKRKGYFPGKLGFDPLGLYPTDEKGQKWMQTAEIKNGRLAMLAITGFCFQEVVTHIAVVDQTPIFFKPILEVLNDQVPGYIIPEEVVQEAATTATSSVDAAAGATAEAITVAPPVDAISGATAESITVTPPVDAISGAAKEALPVAPPFFDDVSAASAETAAVTPPTDAAQTVSVEEYAAAKKRIVELESKLAAISELSH